MEHYYTHKPATSHKERKLYYEIGDGRLKLTTDTGVFSKERIDYGTHILIKTLPPITGDILDLGCGYGVIGISLAKRNPASHVTMVDINQRAVDLASKNIRDNHLTNATAFQSDGFQRVSGSYDAIVSNPPVRTGKKVIYALFEQSISFLKPGGALFIVIQKKQGAKSALEKLKAVYGNCSVLNKKGGYWVLSSVRTE